MAEPGQRVGGFRLVRELGSGGFGSVYLGEDASGRRAAVKMLHPHLAKNPRVRRYFSQELVNASRVQGFCLAAIVDAAPEAHQPWIATEYVQGPTLDEAIRERGPLLGGDLQRLAVQTITALSAIHAAGVVHRDLKPSNILLGPDGPRVIDFGIARALDADTSSATRIGSLGYMAPEQIEGAALGPAADLFAWGATIIFAATGSPAFPGPTHAARINRVLNKPPQTGGLVDPLLAIVLACTAKNPVQRPTARQVLDMLLTGSTKPAPPGTVPESDEETRLLRAAKSGNSYYMRTLGLLLRQRKQNRRAEYWYRQAAENGRIDAMEDLGLMLQRRSALRQAEFWLRRGAATGRRSAMLHLGGLLVHREKTAEAADWYRRAAEDGDIRSMYMLSTLLRERDQTDEASTWHRHAEEARSWSRRASETGDIYAMNGLGLLLDFQWETAEAEVWYRRSADAGNYFAMDNLSNFLTDKGEYEEAEAWRRCANEPSF